MESAITSRLTNEVRIPSVPMVMPSEMETVIEFKGRAAGFANSGLDVFG